MFKVCIKSIPVRYIYISFQITAIKQIESTNNWIYEQLIQNVFWIEQAEAELRIIVPVHIQKKKDSDVGTCIFMYSVIIK